MYVLDDELEELVRRSTLLQFPPISRLVQSVYALRLSLWDKSQGSVAANQKQPTDTLKVPLCLLKHW